jgi:nucleotide-binding universal stress UspA family protein
VIDFEHVLCPIDFSDTSVRALVTAAAFASAHGARLSVLHVVPVFDESMRSYIRTGQSDHGPYAVRAVVEATMRRFVEQAGAAAPDPALLAEEGPVGETIVSRAASLGADLLVMGTHGSRGFNRLLLGSVTEKVLRTAPCAVLTVSPASTIPPTATFRNILCPIDFSPSASKALGLALQLARQSGGSVTVLHAIEFMDDEEPCEHVDIDVRTYRRHLLEHARQRVHAEVAGRPGEPCEIDEVVAINRAYREILQRAAASPIDLIVMGAQGHGGIELMLYGSNTQNVVRRAVCPVLVVRE